MIRIVAWLWRLRFRRCPCGLRLAQLRLTLDDAGAFVRADCRCPDHGWFKVTR